MRYFLEFKERANSSWKKSINIHPYPENQEDGFNSLGELLNAITDRGHIPDDMNYRIRKVPEQPEEEVLE